MHKVLQETCDLLDDLYNSVIESSSSDEDFSQINGWNWPSVNRRSLALLPYNLSKKIKAVAPDEIDEVFEEEIENANQSIENLKQQTLPYMFNGNGSAALPTYITSLACIEAIFAPLFDWKVLNDNKALPPALTRRLRSIEADLDEITPKKEVLRNQIKLIEDATEAAENLPTDLQSLIEARKTVESLATSAAELFGKIDTYNTQSGEAIKAMTEKQQEAVGIVQQASEAYRVTTSVGLAAAFDERAKKSTESMWIWVVGLIAALIIGSILGSLRIALLSDALKESDPHWGVIAMHALLSLLSVGAPLWFAWLSTKQINQRFRLSEDYAFKASVAKAYEGYRREAARIDPLFEARLFSSALERLEEAPLRLVENDVHGSPWHELFSSKPFQEALRTVPEFKDTIIQMMKDKLPNLNKASIDDIKATINKESVSPEVPNV